jgi:hypothetical protein
VILLKADEIIESLNAQNQPTIKYRNQQELFSKKIDLKHTNEIPVFDNLFIINSVTIENFTKIALREPSDTYLNKIFDIVKIYSYFDLILFTINHNGYSISSRHIIFTYIQKNETVEKKENPIFHENLCKEISFGPMTECTLGMQDTYYNHKILYESRIFPEFKKLVYSSIGLEIDSFEDFSKDYFELMKMEKI